jgi:hypothetical protein
LHWPLAIRAWADGLVPRDSSTLREGNVAFAYHGQHRTTSHPRFTIIIVDAVRPYAYEINNILALPPGFGYRCRYRQRRVRVEHAAERLQGTDGLVILRCFEDGRLYPLRKIRVDGTRKVGDIVYIKYLVGDWIKLSSSQTERQSQIDRFNALVSANLEEANQPGRELQHLVFFGQDFCYFLDEWPSSADEPTTDDERWGNTVDEVRRIPIYHEYDFLKVVQLTDENQRDASILESDGYRLRPLGTYELEMLQRRHTLSSDDQPASSNRLIRLLMNERDYRPIEDTFSVSARYDLFRYRFQTTSDRLRRHSFMLLRNEASTHSRDLEQTHDTDVPATPSQIVGAVPDVLIPTVIDRTRAQLVTLVVRIALAVLLAAIYVVPDAVVSGAGRAGFRLPVQQTTISQLSGLLLILVLTGSFDALIRALPSRLR